eukprot:TRINITY_DN69172_c0_g1_i1.p2 TRINITY_DN69172_c0_g1~~TRINITY_DN69172_c0_g1_i1.p2  ORF type:complete len:147 (+),score=34.25 TRINITY_DN69172_c0_g1_i1:425-865(+)
MVVERHAIRSEDGGGSAHSNAVFSNKAASLGFKREKTVDFTHKQLFAVEEGLREEITAAENGVAGELVGDAFGSDGRVEFHDPAIGGDHLDEISCLGEASENTVAHLSLDGGVAFTVMSFFFVSVFLPVQQLKKRVKERGRRGKLV